MSLEILLAYTLAVVIIVAVPGPNVILIVNDSIKYGLKKGIMTILGIKAGITLLFAVSLSGFAALLLHFSSLMTVIKWVGAFYLAYLGISQILRSFRKNQRPDSLEEHRTNFFWKGFLVSATNPKGLLFAGAFFPQFMNDQTPIGLQALILCIAFLLISSVIEIIYSYIGSRTGEVFGSERFKTIAERISGSALILFGIGLSFVKKEG